MTVSSHVLHSADILAILWKVHCEECINISIFRQFINIAFFVRCTTPKFRLQHSDINYSTKSNWKWFASFHSQYRLGCGALKANQTEQNANAYTMQFSHAPISSVWVCTQARGGGVPAVQRRRGENDFSLCSSAATYHPHLSQLQLTLWSFWQANVSQHQSVPRSVFNNISVAPAAKKSSVETADACIGR